MTVHPSLPFLPAQGRQNDAPPLRLQLLKWVGNKQRFANQIIAHFPSDYGIYFEPFLGSGAVLGTLAPRQAVASDVLPPLIEIWRTLLSNPEELCEWYRTRWQEFQTDRAAAYLRVRVAYNERPNAADLLFLSRACYGGVIRFRRDGYISTPVGIHSPIAPQAFRRRVELWRERVRNTEFLCSDFELVFERAKPGDLVYCDPPYADTQAILYGAQSFSLERLFGTIRRAKQRGVYVALSIDGHKKSGSHQCEIPIPDRLFDKCVHINCGRSMLRRFQLAGRTLESENVADRLLLTWT